MNNDVYVHFYSMRREQSISLLYKSSDNLHSWEFLSSQLTSESLNGNYLPTRGSTLATYQSQLLLLGGTYIVRDYLDLKRNLNRIIWSYDFAQRLFTLQSNYPSAPIQREYVSAVNPKDPECLILATAHQEHSLSVVVEVLFENQWYVASPFIPIPSVPCLTVHEGELYCASDTAVYHCSLQSMIDFCVQQGVSPRSQWKHTYYTNAPSSSLVFFGQRLLGRGEPLVDLEQLYIYYPKFNLWLPMNSVVVHSMCDHGTILRPDAVVGIPGELLLLTVLEHSVHVHRAVLTGKCIVWLDYSKAC